MMRTLLLSAVLLTMSSAVQGQAPPDFGVRLEFGCAVPDIMDTFKGTYERVMSKGRRIAKVKVSGDLRDQLFHLVTEARFFETTEYVTGFGLCNPTTSYRLYVKSGGRVHVVRWNDCHSGVPSTDEGRRYSKSPKNCWKRRASPPRKPIRNWRSAFTSFTS